MSISIDLGGATLTICRRVCPVAGMNQIPWGLGFSLFVRHRHDIAGMTLIDWQMLPWSYTVWSYGHLHMQRSNPKRLGDVRGRGDPECGGPMPPIWGPTVGTRGHHPCCSAWGRRDVHTKHCLSCSCRGDALVQLQRRSPHRGAVRRQAILAVYFTGSFFIIIYLKCTRGEDNLRTHPENSK